MLGFMEKWSSNVRVYGKMAFKLYGLWKNGLQMWKNGLQMLGFMEKWPSNVRVYGKWPSIVRVYGKWLQMLGFILGNGCHGYQDPPRRDYI